MSLSIPRKKKVIIIIIVAANILLQDLENDIDGTIQETLLEHLAAAQFCLFNVENWTADHEAAWAAIEDIYEAVKPESTKNPDWQSLVDELGAKLAQL